MKYLLRSFKTTRSAVRSGKHLWDLPDKELVSAGYMSASAFNRFQNILSITIASPLIFVGSQVLDAFVNEYQDQLTYDACIWSWLSILWSIVTPVFVAFVAPIAVTATVLSLAHARPEFDETALKAFRYKSGAFTLATKTLFLASYGSQSLVVRTWTIGIRIL